MAVRAFLNENNSNTLHSDARDLVLKSPLSYSSGTLICANCGNTFTSVNDENKYIELNEEALCAECYIKSQSKGDKNG
jgi:hypothetical protein